LLSITRFITRAIVTGRGQRAGAGAAGNAALGIGFGRHWRAHLTRLAGFLRFCRLGRASGYSGRRRIILEARRRTRSLIRFVRLLYGSGQALCFGGIAAGALCSSLLGGRKTGTYRLA
jgi:hypothetical protein